MKRNIRSLHMKKSDINNWFVLLSERRTSLLLRSSNILLRLVESFLSNEKKKKKLTLSEKTRLRSSWLKQLLDENHQQSLNVCLSISQMRKKTDQLLFLVFSLSLGRWFPLLIVVWRKEANTREISRWLQSLCRIFSLPRHQIRISFCASIGADTKICLIEMNDWSNYMFK